MYVRNVDYPTDLLIIFADNCLYIIDWCCCSSTINSLGFLIFLLHASFVHNITDRELYRYSFTPGHHKCFLINIVFYTVWFYCSSRKSRKCLDACKRRRNQKGKFYRDREVLQKGQQTLIIKKQFITEKYVLMCQNIYICFTVVKIKLCIKN